MTGGFFFASKPSLLIDDIVCFLANDPKGLRLPNDLKSSGMSSVSAFCLTVAPPFTLPLFFGEGDLEEVDTVGDTATVDGIGDSDKDEADRCLDDVKDDDGDN